MNYYDDDIVCEALALYDRDVSLHEIERRTGINRSTLLSVLKNPESYCISNKKLFVARVPSSVNTGPYMRCRKCGHEVQMPCLICQTREYLRLKKLKA